MAVVKREWAGGGSTYYAAYMANGKQYREKVGWLPPDAKKGDHKDMRTEAQALALERKRQRLNGTLVLPHQKEEKRVPLTFT